MFRAFRTRRYLHDAVVSVLREVDHPVRKHLAPHVQAVHVSLGPAGRDVSPCFIPRQMHQVGEKPDHLSLHLVGVHLKIAVVKGVSDVVGGHSSGRAATPSSRSPGCRDSPRAGNSAHQSPAAAHRDALESQASLKRPPTYAVICITLKIPSVQHDIEATPVVVPSVPRSSNMRQR